MKILVIGAGATYAEAHNLGVEESLRLPLMRNFAQKTWEKYNPHPYLDRYLETHNIVVENDDGRGKFYELEVAGVVNIEHFFEFCWNNRDKSWSWSDNPSIKAMARGDKIKPNDYPLPKDFICGFRATLSNGTSAPFMNELNDFWSTMLRRGLGGPFNLMMIQCFYDNQKGIKNFSLTRKIISTLSPGDVVINLNYDPVFEIALHQAGRHFIYSPEVASHCITVCKPHGSLNMLVIPNNIAFTFRPPEHWSMPDPPASEGFCRYLGLIPPRFNKNYHQNPMAKLMLDSIREHQPEELTFWGVGFTRSDIDLLELFEKWVNSNSKPKINVINPDADVPRTLKENLNIEVIHFNDAQNYAFEQGYFTFSYP